MPIFLATLSGLLFVTVIALCMMLAKVKKVACWKPKQSFEAVPLEEGLTLNEI
jgi:hypothetical protein